MSFNYITLPAYHQAIRSMFSQKLVSDGMLELDVVVRQLAPHPIWNELRKISLADESAELTDWVARELPPYSENVSILYFGLSDMGDTMSLFVYEQKREPKDEHDWGAYSGIHVSDAPSKVLKHMRMLAERQLSDGKGGYTNRAVHWITETCYPLAYAGLTVGAIMRILPSTLLLGKDTRRRVAVFFGEGDDFFLGQITSQGFDYYSVPDFVP